MNTKQQVCILGSTGSIGVNTLDVIARHPETMRVYALSAYSRIELLVVQAIQTGAKVLVVPNDQQRTRLLDLWPTNLPRPEIRVGSQALADTAADP
ncbi:1-deoxy-D-xylulose-5-phosphate reductoisomerase, partial [Photobacterium phosphoreum]|nr:1-deoxy-D-xylulose-5-phosphate reductoisomerase [Photobacterium phosphoreum]